MSEKEAKRRKIARAVMKRAWLTFRKCFLTWSACLRFAWKTVRFKQPVYYSKVYGTTFENRQKKLITLLNYKQENIRLFFQREEDNIFDKNAIRIIAKVDNQHETHIGYVSKDWARRIAPYLDQGYQAMVLLTQITGDLSKGRFLGMNYEFIILKTQ